MERNIRSNFRCSISKYHLLQDNEFEIARIAEHFDIERPANLYFILSKNRITINPEYVAFNDERIEIEFLINNQGEKLKERVSYDHNYNGLEELKVVSEHPFNQFKVVDENGDPLLVGKTTYFPEHASVGFKNDHFLDYEILYIGQSTGTETHIPVMDRILDHSTLQRIQSDYLHTQTDKEIFLLFCSAKIDAWLDVPEQVEEKEEFMRNFQEICLTPSKKNKKSQITLIEAALINHFKPKYNDDYVNDFPNKKHKGYNDYYKVNIGELNVLIGLEDFQPRLYTESIPRNAEHRIRYEF